jgi:hypothetical protein
MRKFFLSLFDNRKVKRRSRISQDIIFPFQSADNHKRKLWIVGERGSQDLYQQAVASRRKS